jgi:hypothetical protein
VNESEVLDALIATWQRDVAPYVRPDCCILAARVTSAVLDYYGIGNKVLPCEAIVYNDAAIAELEKGNSDFKQWPAGAWSIGAGRYSKGKGYAGHVIVHTDGGNLVDLSAAQFHRPNLIEIDGPRIWSEGVRDYAGVSFIVRDNGCTIGFNVTRDASYRTTPDWRKGREEAARIIRTINNNGRINK